MRKPQKFFRGDRVHITKDMPSCMSHFTKDVDGIVLGSYGDQFPCNDDRSWHIYTVYVLPNGGSHSWYNEDQLTKIKGPHGVKLASRLLRRD